MEEVEEDEKERESLIQTIAALLYRRHLTVPIQLEIPARGPDSTLRRRSAPGPGFLSGLVPRRGECCRW